jgi:UDP-N-acetylglucosamine--N-acetylmuramyl-(pentapeptide) pyrophosphoryl-undecaprenol N-acetylglucosamine transferase
MAGHDKAFIVPFIDDLYPYYAIAKVLIGRSGASTLSEAAYFALPVVMIPLPWSADNHQWKNAGIVEQQGWGMRIEQNQQTSGNVEQAVLKILQDEKMHEKMRHNASQFSPEKAAGIIVKTVLSQVKN